MEDTRGVSQNIQANSSLRPYEEMKTRAKVDLALKNIFFGTIVALNLVALGSIYTYITLYCPIRTEPLIASSFVVGVIGGLVSLKVPTLGVNNFNLNQYLSPVTLVGRTLAYIFFGPALLVKEQIDWTKYGNSSVANQISGEIERKDLEFFAKKYGPNIDNLVKYGFIDMEKESQVRKLYDEYKVLTLDKKDILYYAKNLIELPAGFKGDINDVPNQTLLDALPQQGELNVNNELIVELKQKLEQLIEKSREWDTLKGEACLFPTPKRNGPNFKHWHVRVIHKIIDILNKQIDPQAASA